MADTVVNAPNTGHLKAYDVCGCSSWIQHWRTHTGSGRASCMSIGCANEPVHGAHVTRYRGRTVYIIGLCASCNHSRNTDPFDVDERSGWAPSTYSTGCGVLYDLVPGDVVLRSPTSTERLLLLEVISAPTGDSARWLVRNTRRQREERAVLDGRKVRRVRSL